MWVILWRLIPDALELAAANAHDRNTDFILKLWIVSHLQRARLDAINRLCPDLAKNIEACPAFLPILLNLQEVTFDRYIGPDFRVIGVELEPLLSSGLGGRLDRVYRTFPLAHPT